MPVRGGISLPHTFPWRLLSERRNHPIRTPPFLLPGLKCLSWVTRKFQRGSDGGPGALWGQAQAAWLCLAQPLSLTASSLYVRCSGRQGWARVTGQNWPNCVQSTVSGLLARPAFFTAVLSARRCRGAWAAARRPGSPASCGRKVTSAASSTLWLCPP